MSTTATATRDFNYSVLRPMMAVCTASASPAGRLIRLWTARLKKLNGLRESFRLKMANHVGLIVEHSSRLWIAEMLSTGLEINSLRDYLRSPRNVITHIVSNPLFDNVAKRDIANEFVINKAHLTVPYDWMGSPGSFTGLCGEGPEEWYCSEMDEVVANVFGGTWDRWQLHRGGKKKRIAPVEIERGVNAMLVEGWLVG